MKTNIILEGDALEKLKELPDESIDCVMTSPPYWAMEIFINQQGFIILMRDKKTGRFLKGYTYKKSKFFWNKKWLYNEYIINEKSATEIADKQNCHRNNILFWLAKHNIKIRSISQARKIKYWGLKGEDNPMFNKIGELNSNWKGGISKFSRKFYSSKKWKDICKKVWNRDNNVCQRCKIKYYEGLPFHVHHIKSITEDNYQLINLILLCKNCHDFIHSKLNKNREFISKEV